MKTQTEKSEKSFKHSFLVMLTITICLVLASVCDVGNLVIVAQHGLSPWSFVLIAVSFGILMVQFIVFFKATTSIWMSAYYTGKLEEDERHLADIQDLFQRLKDAEKRDD